MPANEANMYLVPISGPPLEPIQLQTRDGGLTIGRHEQCDLALPADAEKVSRFHARFNFDGSAWKIADLSSRWGTYLNGQRISPGPDVPLKEGDLIRITPWTFTLSTSPKRRGLQAHNDTGQTVVRAVSSEQVAPLREDMLSLLLESAAALHGASDEKQLADFLMDTACRGTGLTNAAMLRPIDSAGQIEVIATRGAPNASGNTSLYSRSLLAAAANGNVAELSGGANSMGGDISQSIVQMKINAAICVPLMLGGVPAAYLYLDSRGTVMQTLRPNASAFCVALGRIASLALANLKRVDMERRTERTNNDLKAASIAAKMILPRRTAKIGTFEYVGQSKPSLYVGGDFFDVIQISPSRIAVALGDVSGKGVEASVLMTATLGFLRAALQSHGELSRAANELNQFIAPRRPDSKFVTMWLAVLDSEKHTISYVDAGHSYALMRSKDGKFKQLNEGGGLPIGVDETIPYNVETTTIEPGDTVMVVSDGIVEQYGMVQRADGSLGREHFEVAGVQKAWRANSADPVADLFAAVVAHAGTDQLSDDATAVLVRT